MDNIYFSQLYTLLTSTILFIVLFFFLSFIKKQSYLNKFLKCLTVSFIVFTYFSFLKYENFYIFLISSLFFFLIIFNIHVFFYAPISSIRFKIISILINNNYLIKKSILSKIYNDKIIFNLRIERLLNSKTIFNKKDYLYLNLGKTHLIILINNFLKNLFNIK